MSANISGEVTTLFWDVGGVILSDGWDTAERREAAQHFGIDLGAFEKLHAEWFPPFEMGKMTLAEYLDRAVFDKPRSFSREDFTAFMFSLQTEKEGTRAVLDELTAVHRYLLMTLNNEGEELNQYRISTFQLSRNFTAFLSSCYLGLRKPDPAIYRAALGIVQRPPAQCVMIDDREENLEPARHLGMRTIQFQSPGQLRAELEGLGVLGVAA